MISDIVSKDLRGTGFGIYHAVLGITLPMILTGRIAVMMNVRKIGKQEMSR